MVNCPNPDHEDRFPSASINEETGEWRCFGCGKTGVKGDPDSVEPLGWEEKGAFEVEAGDTVVFSQFFGPSHMGLLRSIDTLPIMITVNGRVSKAEEVQVDDYNVRKKLTVQMWSDCIMHGTGMTEQYRFAEHGEEGVPVFTFTFHADEKIGVVTGVTSN
jgi:hypothetical protein